MPGVRESPQLFYLPLLCTHLPQSRWLTPPPAPDAMDQVKKGWRSLFSKKKPVETTTPSKTSDNPPVANPTKTEPAAVLQPAAQSAPAKTGAPSSSDPTAPPAGMMSSPIDTLVRQWTAEGADVVRLKAI